jgi:hypothetical protein
MLIERLMRDRGTAIQSGPSDVGLFGATPETFQNWSHGSDLTMSIGNPRPALASEESSGGTPGYSRGQAVALAEDTHFSTNQLAGLDHGAASQNSVAGSIDTHVDIDVSASYSTGSGAASGFPLAANQIAHGSGTQFIHSVHVETHANSVVVVETAPTPPALIVPEAIEAAQAQGMQTAAVLEDVQAAAAAQLEQLSSTLASEIAALKEQTDAAIAALTSEAAEQVAALQQTVAGLVEPVVDSVAALPGTLVQHVDALATSLVPPVLDTITALPAAIGTATNLSVSADLGAEIALGGQEIAVDLGTSLSTATALDMDLPISGNDVAGGISTLLDMLGSASSFVIENAASGVEWLGDALAPSDTLAALADDGGIDLLDAGAIEPGAILLGIADHGADLLGGLSHLDDHGHG